MKKIIKLIEKESPKSTEKESFLEKHSLPYISAGEGFCRWVEQNVCLAVYPPGSPIPKWTPVKNLPENYQKIWTEQKVIAKEALVMKEGRFKHRLIVLCWMRGEGKSFLAVLIQLWKFFCFPKQSIMLGANSATQVKFVHYDQMREIILNSPKLLKIVGRRNILEKQIQIRDKKDNVVSFLRSISTFSGIVSNITGYTFSEFFDQKKPTFFVQLDGSTRNIPNAIGVIDSTVSTKDHQLYRLYKLHLENKDPSLYFSYRCSPEGKAEDFFNPGMTQEQLDSYSLKFPPAEFDRYFKNLWDAGSTALFTPEMLRASRYIGVDKKITTYTDIKELVTKIIKNENVFEAMKDHYQRETGNYEKLQALKDKLYSIEDVYQLRSASGIPQMALISDLAKLEDMYDSHSAICVGVDRADPLKVSDASAARTIVAVIAKLLPHSRSHPFMLQDGVVPKYHYFLLHLAHCVKNTLDEIKYVLSLVSNEYTSIQSFASERWGMSELPQFAEEIQLPVELIHPTYDRQRAAFNELYSLFTEGRFKMPPIGVVGSKTDNVLIEELGIFQHDLGKRWFGSLEKPLRYGIQDDAVYALGLALYSGRDLTPDDFMPRDVNPFFGQFYNA